MCSTRFDWADKKVLVTGATGMLGVSLLRELRNRNALGYALSRHGAAVPGAHGRIACDLADGERLIRELEAEPFDVVVHLAAQSQDVETDPRSTFDTNIGGTLNVLEGLRCTASTATLVIASSRAVDEASQLPESSRLRVDGRARRRPLRPYEASKICAEVVARCYRETFDVNVGVLRLPNLFGPGDRNMRRLVPGTIGAALAGRAPTIRSSTGTLLSFLFVDEASRALLRLAERLAGGEQASPTVSMSGTESVTLGAMVAAILARMDRSDLMPTAAPSAASASRDTAEAGDASDTARIGDAADADADAAHAAGARSAAAVEEWRWTAKIPMTEALDRTIEWYRRNYAE